MSGDRPEIVFVCSGNRARSPLAEALLQRRLGEDVRVSSRGTLALGPLAALPEMVRAARSVGIDLAAHTAQTISRGELAEADLVLGFELDHVASAVVDGGARRDVVFTLPGLLQLVPVVPATGHSAGERLEEVVRGANLRQSAADRLKPLTIADPLGQRQSVFDRLVGELDELTGRLARVLAG